MGINIFLAAFAGAFFAFLFARLAEFLSKVYKRETMHYNSLVTLGTELNEYIGMIKDNVFVIDGFIKTILVGNVHFGKLKTLPVNKTHYANLHNIDLINDLFSFLYQVRKMNDDMENINSGYEEVKSAYTGGKISKQDYIVNTQIASEQLKIIKAFLGSLELETLNLLAKIRIYIRRDIPLGTRLMQILIKKEGKIDDKEIAKELKSLKGEMAEVGNKSRQEIRKIVKKNNLIKP